LLVLALSTIVAAAAAVRLGFLSVPVRPDEALTFLRYASQPWHDGVSDYSLPNNHLLNTLAVHASWRVFGQDEWTLRLFALLTGIATVPAAYLLGRELYRRQAALWGAALVAGSSALIQYSVNGRGYMPGTFFVVAAMACASWAARTHRALAWAGFGACSVLAVYSVPSMVVGVAVSAVWVTSNALAGAPGPRALRERWASGRRTLGELGVTLAASALVATALYAPTLGDEGWTPAEDVRADPRGAVPRADSFDEKWQLLRDIWGLYNEGLPFVVRLVVLGAVLLAIVRHPRLGRHAVPLAPVALIVALPVVLAWDVPVFARNWIGLLPLYLVTAGAGLALVTGAALERLPRRAAAASPIVSAALPLAATAVLTLAFAVRGEDALVMSPPRADPEVAELKRRTLPREPLLASRSGALAAAYYFRRDGVRGLTSEEPIPGYPDEALRPLPTNGRLAILAINGAERPEHIATSAGIRLRRPATPLLLARSRYTSVYEVQAER
jgi:Dolichyl-phosphate-mannose-protein mannosyltransferase